MKKIKLSQGQFALVDDDDFVFLNQWKWSAKFSKKTNSFYAFRRSDRQNKTEYMHRAIMKTPDGLMCDHKNHNTLDNQKQNLRNCTHSQNMMNRKSIRCKTGYLGITTVGNGFRAQVTINKKCVHFPVRKTIEEANLDREKAIKSYYGEFGVSNNYLFVHSNSNSDNNPSE